MQEILIEVLGPVRVVADGAAVRLRGHTERALVAALVITLNHPVSVDQLELALWGEQLPVSARNTLQSSISRLNAKLGGAISSDGHCYCLNLEPERIDAVRFERCVAEAAEALDDDPARTAELTAEAMTMWRGVPFDGLCDEEFALPEVTRLEELRLAAVELRLEAAVVQGKLAQAIPRLRAELTEQPYQERLWYLLMLALARDGRRVDALRCCQEVRERMADIGLEASHAIQRLEMQIIEEEPTVQLRLSRAVAPPEVSEDWS